MSMRVLVVVALLALGVSGAYGNNPASSFNNSNAYVITNYIAPDDYHVTKEGSNLRMKFKKKMKVRVHTSPNFAPYGITYGHSKNDILVKPGQWVEVWILSNGRWVWARATDADNR